MPNSSSASRSIKPLRRRAGDELARGIWRSFRSFFLLMALMQRVGVGQRDVAQAVENPHHLLLIDHHAVRLFQHLLHHRMLVLGFLRPCFTCT